VWQAPAEGDSKQAVVEKSGDQLKISWRDARTADTSAMIHSDGREYEATLVVGYDTLCDLLMKQKAVALTPASSAVSDRDH